MSKRRPDSLRDLDAEDHPAKDSLTGNLSGRIQHDERGNAIWQWATRTGEVAARRQAPAVAKDAPTPIDPVKPNPMGTLKGYSPYNSGLLVKKKAAKPRKDLRKLSEWVKLKKSAERNRKES